MTLKPTTEDLGLDLDPDLDSVFSAPTLERHLKIPGNTPDHTDRQNLIDTATTVPRHLDPSSKRALLLTPTAEDRPRPAPAEAPPKGTPRIDPMVWLLLAAAVGGFLALVWSL